MESISPHARVCTCEVAFVTRCGYTCGETRVVKFVVVLRVYHVDNKAGHACKKVGHERIITLPKTRSEFDGLGRTSGRQNGCIRLADSTGPRPV